MNFFCRLLLIWVSSASFQQSAANEWNQFRGPNGSGVLEGARPPIRFDGQDPTWHQAIPSGHASPVLWGQRLFLTGLEEGLLQTLCLDTRSGHLLWKQQAPKVILASHHKASSPAASTPCVDEQRVYVYFDSFGLLCYDHEGNEIWKRPIPTPKSLYGMSSSPITSNGKVFLVLDNDLKLPESQLRQSKLMALDGATGEILWETPRPYQKSGWSTPALWAHGGKEELVVLGNGRAYGYDLQEGKELWYVNGFSRETIAVPIMDEERLFLSAARQGGAGDEVIDPEPFWSSLLTFDQDQDGRISKEEITDLFTLPIRPELPVEHPGFGIPLPKDPKQRQKRQADLFGWRDKNQDGFLSKEEFVSEMMIGNGRPHLCAITPGGRGDITQTHLAWSLHRGIPEIPSPVVYEDRLYLLRSGGMLSGVDTITGRMLFQERLGASGQYSASPVRVDQHLLAISESGILSVIPLKGPFQVAHQTSLNGSVHATPAMDMVTLYIRTTEALLAFRGEASFPPK